MPNADTNKVVSDVERIVRKYHLCPKREVRLRSKEGASSQRTDIVVFHADSASPNLNIEIDHVLDRAQYNRLKIFGAPIALAQIPISNISIHFGAAASAVDPAELVLQEGYVLPPQFIHTICIDPQASTFDSQLEQNLKPYLTGAAYRRTAGASSVSDLQSYRTLQCGGALAVATSHLNAVSEYTWSLTKRREATVEDAAAKSCAHLRLLQEAGRDSEARNVLKRLREHLRQSQTLISLELQDEIDTVDFKLAQPRYGSSDSSVFFDQVAGLLASPNNKAKFQWRQALEATVRNQPHRAAGYSSRYADAQGSVQNGQANQALVNAFAPLWDQAKRGRDRAIENAIRYAPPCQHS